MPTLSDLLKLKHLLWQTTKIDAQGTLVHIMGSDIGKISTMAQLMARKLTGTDLRIIRELYDSVRRVETIDNQAKDERYLQQCMVGYERQADMMAGIDPDMKH